jgi:DNA-directed RNA polymerase specialized sigma24 family protein
MGKTEWLATVAKQHKEWVRIVESMGEKNYAEDIVQEAYIALYKYAKPKNIIENGIVKRGYMFFTLRSLMFQYYNKKKKIHKVSLDDDANFLQIPDTNNIQENKAFHKICQMIDQEAEKWHWYDRKMFKLYRDTDMSIRKIAMETTISWVSIFNTLKNCKDIIKEKFGEDYLDYKNEDYDRI